jgi:hypothetical protein
MEGSPSLPFERRRIAKRVKNSSTLHGNASFDEAERPLGCVCCPADLSAVAESSAKFENCLRSSGNRTAVMRRKAGLAPQRGGLAISVSFLGSACSSMSPNGLGRQRHARLVGEIVGFRRPLQASSDLFSWKCWLASRPIRENESPNTNRRHPGVVPGSIAEHRCSPRLL